MSAPPSAAGWRGFHLFYHADTVRLLGETRPLAASLVADGLVRRFFLIRYDLGGPHVRLRVEVDDADAPAVAARVRAAAADFFRRAPSTETLPDEQVHRVNRGIIAEDPFAGEEDDVVFPDNSVAELPVHFEMNRYGGPDLYDHSLSFFTLSTVEALGFLEAHAGVPAGRRLADAARLLVRQAWGHAEGEDDFVPLATYAVRTLGDRLAGLFATADAAFERSGGAMCALVQGELARLAAPGEGPALAEGARALAHAVRGAPGPVRRMVATGQMHMTSNRLGLRNGDEVYLCRMLARAFEAAAAEDPASWRAAWEAHRERLAAPVLPLDERLRLALVSFAGQGALAAV